MLEARAQAEQRQKLLALDEERRIQIKKKQSAEKADYQRRVRSLMVEKADKEKQVLINAREKKEIALKAAYDQRQYHQMIKKEAEMIKREERLDNVARIGRANQHAKDKILKKIEFDLMKSKVLEDQKKDLLEQRRKIKHQLTTEKDQLMHAVEEMKRTGNFNRSQLAAYGIDLSKSPERESVDHQQLTPNAMEVARMNNTHTIGFGNKDIMLESENKRRS